MERNRIPGQNGAGEKDIVLPVPAVNTLALSHYYCLSKGHLDGHEPFHYSIGLSLCLHHGEGSKEHSSAEAPGFPTLKLCASSSLLRHLFL